MLRNRVWTPKQAQILRSTTPELAVDGGRRFGKSYTCATAFVMRIMRRHSIMAARVRSGEIPPWQGAGKAASDARHYAPHVEAWVVTPRERHLESCKQYILNHFAGSFRRFMHPKLGICDAGRQIWLYYNGVATRIRFVTGSSAASVVAESIDVLWVDEAGLIEHSIIAPAMPLLWQREGEFIASGTPALGVEHWFSQMCLRGLEPDHPYYVPDVVERDPRVTTIIGTSYEAFDKNVRDRAKADAKRLGEAWEAQWIRGDWRMPGLFVYDNWDPQKHVIDYDPDTRKWVGRQYPLPQPNRILGLIDWSYSTAKPGACVVFHIWHRNPLDLSDSRPLVIAVEDRQEKMEYTKAGWYDVFRQLRIRYGVSMWYADPSREQLIMQARRMSNYFGVTKGAPKADKAGRMTLVKALLESSDGSEPAFYITAKCKNLARQFGNYKWILDSQKNPTDRPQDHDDHCLDCVAFLMGVIGQGGFSFPTALV